MSTRKSFTATVTIDEQVIGTVVKYSHNSAMQAGKGIVRDLNQGAWTIEFGQVIRADGATTLPLTNERTNKVAFVTVREVEA